MEKVRPWCGQPSDRGRLKNRTEPQTESRRLCLHLIVAMCAAAFTDCSIQPVLPCLRNQFPVFHRQPRANFSLSLTLVYIGFQFFSACVLFLVLCGTLSQLCVSQSSGQRAGLRRRRARVQIAVATLSGNSLRQTVHTHRASVHQAAKLVTALIRVAGLAESSGSLPPGL